jgi:MoaA/NifB/PqqE/SkfB family radical SAM enzyme
MDAKDFLKNKSICALPWTGFQLEPGGVVKNCVISTEHIGNINKTPIKDILGGSDNLRRKKDMLADRKPRNCEGCYLQEKGRSNLSSISSRLYYLKEVGSKTDLQIYDDISNFSLKHVDLRWTNSCNQACVYCSADLSSKWAQELNVTVKSKKDLPCRGRANADEGKLRISKVTCRKKSGMFDQSQHESQYDQNRHLRSTL